jgi:hypothetical protein
MAMRLVTCFDGQLPAVALVGRRLMEVEGPVYSGLFVERQHAVGAVVEGALQRQVIGQALVEGLRELPGFAVLHRRRRRDDGRDVQPVQELYLLLRLAAVEHHELQLPAAPQLLADAFGVRGAVGHLQEVAAGVAAEVEEHQLVFVEGELAHHLGQRRVGVDDELEGALLVQRAQQAVDGAGLGLQVGQGAVLVVGEGEVEEAHFLEFRSLALALRASLFRSLEEIFFFKYRKS